MSTGKSKWLPFSIGALIILGLANLVLELNQLGVFNRVEVTLTSVSDAVADLGDDTPQPPDDGETSDDLEEKTKANQWIKAYANKVNNTDKAEAINIPLELHKKIKKQIALRDPHHPSGAKVMGHRAYWGLKGTDTVAVLFPLIEKTKNSGVKILVVDQNVYNDSVHYVKVDNRMEPCPDACYCLSTLGGRILSDCPF